MPAAVTSPLDLLGRWSFRRRIDDRRAGELLRVEGHCVLEPCGEASVRWHEEGLLERPGTVPAADPAPVTRTLYVVRDATRTWRVTFEDGRPFHPWVPGIEVDHPCAPDHYRGRLDLGAVDPATGAPTSWSTTWEVHGPAKDHTIATTYAVPVRGRGRPDVATAD